MNTMFAMARAAAGIVHGSRAFGGPLQANLSLTDRCNIRCEHCYFHSPLLAEPLTRDLRRARSQGAASGDGTQRRPPAEADGKVMQRLVSDLMGLGTRRFQFSGNGEALTHPMALDIMAPARRRGVFCLVNTNGLLIDGAIARGLIELGIDELRITTMGGDAESYRATHPVAPPDAFERLETNLVRLAELKLELGRRRPAVVLVSVVTRTSARHLEGFVDFAIRMRADGIQIKPIDDVYDPGLTALVPTDAQAADVRASVRRLAPVLDAAGVRHAIGDFLNAFHRKLDTRDLYRRVPCVYGWLATVVEADGRVYPCCRAVSPIGDLEREPFRDIWFSERYRAFRRAARRLPQRDDPVDDCDCWHCVHHEANARAHRLLHPLS